MPAVGDYDPEDAWDDGDDEETKLAILERIVDSLRANRDDRLEPRRADALRLVGKLDSGGRRRHKRLDNIREALETL